MKIDKILTILFFALLALGGVLLALDAVGAMSIVFLVSIIEGLVALNARIVVALKHSFMRLDRKHSPEQIKQEVVQVFEQNRWQSVDGIGELNHQYMRMGGMVNGPVLSVNLTEMNSSEYELDMWISECPTAGRYKAPKYTSQAVKLKKAIATACAKFETGRHSNDISDD
jgi:hypothetical protein